MLPSKRGRDDHVSFGIETANGLTESKTQGSENVDRRSGIYLVAIVGPEKVPLPVQQVFGVQTCLPDSSPVAGEAAEGSPAAQANRVAVVRENRAEVSRPDTCGEPGLPALREPEVARVRGRISRTIACKADRISVVVERCVVVESGLRETVIDDGVNSMSQVRVDIQIDSL